MFEDKKATFPVKKKFWHIFSRTVELEKPPQETYKGPEAFSTIIAQMIRSFLRDLKGR